MSVGVKTINENGSYYASADGLDAYYKVIVDVPQERYIFDNVVISKNGLYYPSEPTIDIGGTIDGVSYRSLYYGYSEVTVNVEYSNIDLYVNGVYSASKYGESAWKVVNVNINDNNADSFIEGKGFVESKYYNSYVSCVRSKRFECNYFSKSYMINIREIDFPNCSYIGTNAFNGYSDIEKISMNSCENIGVGAFTECVNLHDISVPNCTFVDANAFKSCYALNAISLPICETLSYNAFCDCSSLKKAIFPVCSYIGGNTFSDCRSLSTVILPLCETIDYSAFSRCYVLSNLYLGGSSICELRYSDTFYSTPIANYVYKTNGQPGSIFVPQSLVNSYKNDSTWSYFSDRIFGYSTFSSGAVLNFGSKTITSNGTYNASSDGKDGWTNVVVNVPVSTSRISTATFTSGGIYKASYNNCDGYSKVVISDSKYEDQLQLEASFLNGSLNFSEYTDNEATRIRGHIFTSMSSLEKVNFSNVHAIYLDAFRDCVNLSYASFRRCTSIERYAFAGCVRLISLYLLDSTSDYRALIRDNTVFESTPIGGYSDVAGRYGSIFVMSKFLQAFKASYPELADRFVVYEE